MREQLRRLEGLVRAKKVKESLELLAELQAELPEAAPEADVVTIAVTPPELAGEGDAHAEHAFLVSEESRLEDQRFSPEVVADLSASGWLRQDVQRRGSYVSTHGLRPKLGHPELLVLNVPAGLVEAVSRRLSELAAYLVATDGRFRRGEVYVDEGTKPQGRMSFVGFDPEANRALGLGAGFLQVVFLP